MPTPVAGPLRLARAGIVAALVLALSALAHRAAGGALPDPLVLVALGSLTLAGTTAAARLRFTRTRLIAVLGGGQLALHHAFDVTAAACAGPAGGHHAAAGCVVDGGATLVAGHGTHEGPWMLLAHVVATVVLALVVAHGERLLELLLAWLTPLRALAVPGVAVASGARPPAPVGAPRHARSRYPGTAPTRGPPAVARPVGSTV